MADLPCIVCLPRSAWSSLVVPNDPPELEYISTCSTHSKKKLKRTLDELVAFAGADVDFWEICPHALKKKLLWSPIRAMKIKPGIPYHHFRFFKRIIEPDKFPDKPDAPPELVKAVRKAKKKAAKAVKKADAAFAVVGEDGVSSVPVDVLAKRNNKVINALGKAMAPALEMIRVMRAGEEGVEDCAYSNEIPARCEVAEFAGKVAEKTEKEQEEQLRVFMESYEIRDYSR